MPRMDSGLAWRAGTTAAALGLLWVIAWFAPTAAAMVSVWARSDTFMHGFLIAPISVWLIYRLRGELAALAPRPDYRMLLPAAVAGFAWLLGEVAAVNALSQFAFVALLVIAVPMFLGLQV